MKKTLLHCFTGLAALVAGHTASAQCPTITCPSDISVNNDPGTCGAVVTYTMPTGSNPCGGATFNYTGTIDTWTVPAGVTMIHIEARGAQGGWNASSTIQPGMGAFMSGDFAVTPGQQLKILVGQQPSNGSGNGGGGGTFVTDMSNNPLIVAGGGGGSSQTTDSPDKHGQIGTSGGTGAAGGGAGGTAGSGGGIGPSGFQSGAGGGLLTNGTDGWTSGTGGLAFVNGGAGGPTNAPANGGFGGGGSGSSYVVGGGGGGYSGGGSGGNLSAGVGGGGGSYNAGTNQNNIAGNNTGHGSVIISYGTGTGVTITRTAGPASGSLFPIGATTVTHQAEDGLGNIVSCSFIVTVTDNTAPVPDVASLPTMSNECSVTLTAPTATDNCAGTVTATTSDPTTYNSQGTYNVTWTYADGNGNTGTQVQTVVIDDVTAPVADVATLPTLSGCSVNVSSSPTATDNCGGTITGTTTDSLNYTEHGTYTITWTYNDGNGNTSTQTQTVNVTSLDTSVTVSGVILTANAPADNYQWLNCDLGTIVGGGTNPNFTALTNGNYALIITDNGCVDTSSCHNINSVGIAPLAQASGISIYPNPTTGVLNLELGNVAAAEVRVYNVYGQSVLMQNVSKTQSTIDLSAFGTGVYHVDVRTAAGSTVVRVVKQ